MKIGIFDSGIGGLVITKAFKTALPCYDYVYYGDTKNLPYGNKTNEQILEYCISAVEYLISKDAKIIIMACNTASAIALRYIQQKYMPIHHPDIKVLGVVIPTLEVAIKPHYKKIGVVATHATIGSCVYSKELTKLAPHIKVQEIATPELVPAIESNNFKKANEIVKEYAKQFENIDSLVLGCTHYPLIKDVFREHFAGVEVTASDEFMGQKLIDYLNNHPEIETRLSKTGGLQIFASSVNEHYKEVAKIIFPDFEVFEV